MQETGSFFSEDPATEASLTEQPTKSLYMEVQSNQALSLNMNSHPEL